MAEDRLDELRDCRLELWPISEGGMFCGPAAWLQCDDDGDW